MKRDVVAPDGADVRILLDLEAGGMASFELAPGETSRAVSHRTVEELWFFTSGRGEMWRKQENQEEIVVVEAGVCLTIPLGTRFQFRSLNQEALWSSPELMDTSKGWDSPTMEGVH
jgi:mannose-6-phosphate isomerase-like protein (cupin superfamily)